MCERVLDVKGEKKDSGGDLILYDRKLGEPAGNQLWYEDEDGIIRSKLNGYVLDCAGENSNFRLGDEKWFLFVNKQVFWWSKSTALDNNNVTFIYLKGLLTDAT